nr:hypothetical protein [Anaerolineae bacterium]
MRTKKMVKIATPNDSRSITIVPTTPTAVYVKPAMTGAIMPAAGPVSCMTVLARSRCESGTSMVTEA